MAVTGLHGRHGRGRFKAFALGTHVEWRTTMKAGDGLLSYTLTGDANDPGVFHLAPAASPGPATGTEVFVTGVRATVESLARPEMVVQTLAAKFALYLKAYPGVSVYFCGLPVSPVIVQKGVADYQVRLDSGAEAKLEVIEWRKKFAGKGRIVFCGRDGFTLYERPSGVRSGQPFSYTAYLVGARFGELAAENALVMDELHPEVRAWLDATRAILKEHFHRRADERSISTGGLTRPCRSVSASGLTRRSIRSRLTMRARRGLHSTRAWPRCARSSTVSTPCRWPSAAICSPSSGRR